MFVRRVIREAISGAPRDDELVGLVADTTESRVNGVNGVRSISEAGSLNGSSE